jgi:hypothetical protein
MDVVLVSSKYSCRPLMINPILMNIYSPVIKYNNISLQDGLNVIKTYPMHQRTKNGLKDRRNFPRSMSWSN